MEKNILRNALSTTKFLLFLLLTAHIFWASMLEGNVINFFELIIKGLVYASVLILVVFLFSLLLSYLKEKFL